MNETSAIAITDGNLTEMTAEIVSAYVAHNSVPMTDLPTLLQSVHAALGRLGSPVNEEPKIEELKPAVPIKKSITDDYLISLEDGQKFKSLKRHLMATYKMTPADYRAKWGLPKDYPMVAPGYASARSALAKSLGLGRKSYVTPPPELAREPDVALEPVKKTRRSKLAAAASAA